MGTYHGDPPHQVKPQTNEYQLMNNSNNSHTPRNITVTWNKRDTRTVAVLFVCAVVMLLATGAFIGMAVSR